MLWLMERKLIIRVYSRKNNKDFVFDSVEFVTFVRDFCGFQARAAYNTCSGGNVCQDVREIFIAEMRSRK